MAEAVVENQQQIFCPRMPLAVYREIVAHLRQVEGVEAGLLPQTSQEFDYLQSQVGGLWIKSVNQMGTARVEQILNYYGDRFGSWQAVVGTTVDFLP